MSRQRLDQWSVAEALKEQAIMTNGCKTAHGWVLSLCVAAAATAACNKGGPAPAETSAAASAQVGANGEKYPAPRWPSYFKTPPA